MTLFFISGHIVSAQQDSIFDAYKKEFEKFRRSAEDDFNKYKTQNDSAFLKFLQQTWKEFEIFRNTPPTRPKPREQPILKEIQDTSKQILEYKANQLFDYNNPVQSKISLDISEHRAQEYKSRFIVKSFNIFGYQAEINYYPDKIPSLSGVNEKSITAFYKDLSDNRSIWLSNVSLLEKIRQSCSLNDWGYYLILKKAAENLFSQINEQILFIWYALVNSGYCAKVGFNNSTIYLLLPARQELYNIQYLTENGLQYYLFQDSGSKPVHIKTFSGFYTDSPKTFSFSLSELPKFNNTESSSRTLEFEKQIVKLIFSKELINFLNSYPQGELGMYNGLPLTFENFKALDKIFDLKFQNMTNRQKVDLLLNFVQNSIAYKTDQEQFGKERYMFAEECLYYPFSDCEDRCALLGQLIKHYTGLNYIGIEFKDHITLAVNLPNEEYGNYIIYEGKKYFFCDPTYINAKSGMLPPDLKNEKPNLIFYQTFD